MSVASNSDTVYIYSLAHPRRISKGRCVDLSLYPNMPTWLIPLGVLTAGHGVAAIGAVAYYLFRKGLTGRRPLASM
jgi:hypothetical protein